jgi:hypothetical protein
MMGLAGSSLPPPNMPMQLTPLRTHKILAFLKHRIGPSAFAIYRRRHS